MVVVEQIYNSFKSVFADFMAEKGLVWNGKCFIGCANNIITRVSVCYDVNRYNAKVDIRVFQLPICCVNLSDIITKLKWGVSIKKIALLDDVSLPDKYDYRNSSVDDVIGKYLEFISSNFDKNFVFSSVCDYIEKKIDGCKTRYDLYNFGENEDILKQQYFIDVDIICIIYAYYKIAGIDKAQAAIVTLLQMYRGFLYDKMKYGNITELGNIHSENEIKTLNKIFENYEKIMYFAEALLEDNKNYFSEIDKKHEKNRIECKEYLNKLTHI